MTPPYIYLLIALQVVCDSEDTKTMAMRFFVVFCMMVTTSRAFVFQASRGTSQTSLSAATIAAADVKALRQESGAGMMVRKEMFFL